GGIKWLESGKLCDGRACRWETEEIPRKRPRDSVVPTTAWFRRRHVDAGATRFSHAPTRAARIPQLIRARAHCATNHRRSFARHASLRIRTHSLRDISPGKEIPRRKVPPGKQCLKVQVPLLADYSAVANDRCARNTTDTMP